MGEGARRAVPQRVALYKSVSFYLIMCRIREAATYQRATASSRPVHFVCWKRIPCLKRSVAG